MGQIAYKVAKDNPNFPDGYIGMYRPVDAVPPEEGWLLADEADFPALLKASEESMAAFVHAKREKQRTDAIEASAKSHQAWLTERGQGQGQT